MLPVSLAAKCWTDVLFCAFSSLLFSRVLCWPHQSTGPVPRMHHACLVVLLQMSDVIFRGEEAAGLLFWWLFHKGRISAGVAEQLNSTIQNSLRYAAGNRNTLISYHMSFNHFHFQSDQNRLWGTQGSWNEIRGVSDYKALTPASPGLS